MRTILYGLFNKRSNKIEYVNYDREKVAEKVINENYEIRYTWKSF